jgi:hypothetical protein
MTSSGLGINQTSPGIFALNVNGDSMLSNVLNVSGSTTLNSNATFISYQTRAQVPEAGTRHRKLFTQNSPCETLRVPPVDRSRGPVRDRDVAANQDKLFWADHGLWVREGGH